MSDPSKSTETAVGIEVTPSMMRAVKIDDSGRVIDSHVSALVRGNDVVPQVVGFVNELRTKFGDFDRIGVTFPGLIRRDNHRVAVSTAFPEHHDIDLLGELESRTRLKIFIENDANSAGFAEHVAGAGRGSRNMFYVTLGAGVGGALIFDDRIWHGAAGFAGEFGYLAIDEEGTRLEDVASATNIVRRTRQRFHQDSTSSLGTFSEEEITVADVVRAANDGDDFAQLMLTRTGKHVGTAIAGVINLLNVGRVVVGGETVDADRTILEAIVNRARELSFNPSFEGTEIVSGELGENAAAIGVALLSKNA